MGMFDTFYDNTEIICHHCNTINNLEVGVQSKQFHCCLDSYSIGDVVNNDNATEVMKDYHWCEECNKRINVYFGFYNGLIFTGIYSTFDDAYESSKNFNMVENYKRLYEQKNSYEERVKTLEYKISETIKIHSNKFETKQFNLITLVDDFLDYDIIKTLQNILKKSN